MAPAVLHDHVQQVRGVPGVLVIQVHRCQRLLNHLVQLHAHVNEELGRCPICRRKHCMYAESLQSPLFGWLMPFLRMFILSVTLKTHSEICSFKAAERCL